MGDDAEGDEVEAGSDDGGSPPPRLTVLLLALPVAVLGIGAFHHRWIADDGLINVRVAENLAAGRACAFASGFRAEAATSPAWALVLAVVHLGTRLPTEVVAVWLGLATTLLGVGLLRRPGRRGGVGPRRPRPRPLPRQRHRRRPTHGLPVRPPPAGGRPRALRLTRPIKSGATPPMG